MLRIQYRDDRTFAFRFVGPLFAKHRHVASDLLSTRKWLRAEKMWVSPLECLDEYLGLVRKRIPEEDALLIGIGAQRAHDRLMDWRQSLRQAQKEGLDGAQTFAQGVKLDVPATFKGTLPPYQAAAVNFLLEAFSEPLAQGVILGDEVGLGKTVEAIAFAEHLRCQGEISTCLVVCPSSLKRKWEAEIRKFTDHEITVLQAKSRVPKRVWDAQWVANTPYSIINYDILWRYEEEIAGLRPGLLLFDEVQYVKGISTKRTKASVKLASRCPRVVGISATFLENTLDDLFSVFQLVDPPVFMDNLWLFRARFTEQGFFNQIVGYKNLEVIVERVKPYVLRRRKEQVADQLAGRIAGRVVETDLWIELAPAQRQLYNQVRDRLAGLLQDMEKARKIIMAEVLPLLSYLRQACLSPALIGAKESHSGSTKLTELYRVLEGFGPGEQFIVFCFYTDMCDMIAEGLNERGFGAIAVHGKNTKPDDRNEICRKFNEGDLTTRWNNNLTPVRVIVASDALREGQDLQGASTLINFDLLWNPQAMKQRAGRIDRIGQRSPLINVINIVAEDTVEERMKDILRDKSDLFDTIVEGGWQSNRLSFEQVKALVM